MFDKLKNIKIPKRTVLFHLSCWGGLLFFALAVIYPVQRSAADIDRQIRDMRYQVEEQKSLQPIYQTLKEKSRNATPSVLPTPERKKLSRDLISMAPSTIKEIAKRAGMDALSVAPDVHSLSGNSPYLLVSIVMQGDFLNFRRYLTGLGELPYLDRIEEIDIQQNPDIMEFRMKVRLALG